MKKEYSDLPDKQKMIYLKSMVIEVLFTLIFAIFGAIFIISSIPNDGVLTSMVKTELEINVLDSLINLLAITSMFSILLFALVGWMIGFVVSKELKLYTDFDLERIEKRLGEIKEVLK